MLQTGHSGDGCDLASTFCKYDFRKGGLFVLSCARMRHYHISQCLEKQLRVGLVVCLKN